jgi:hypothetical protein
MYTNIYTIIGQEMRYSVSKILYMYTYVYICIYIHIYIHIYKFIDVIIGQEMRYSVSRIYLQEKGRNKESRKLLKGPGGDSSFSIQKKYNIYIYR